MSQPTELRSRETSNDPREIGKLARTYAQNRSLGMVAIMVVGLVVFLGISVPSYFGGRAYLAEDWPIFWVCMAVLVAALAANVYIAVPRWGGKLAERITKWLYAGEGRVQVTPPCTHPRKWAGALMGTTFGVCIVVTVILGLLGFLPQQFMQPISAIYFVPFMVALWLLLRPSVGSIMLLWPALYALHAILILAGAPILFVGPWDSLNMFIPVFGYGLLTGLIAHIYSRFVLRRLRQSARGGLPVEAVEEPQL